MADHAAGDPAGDQRLDRQHRPRCFYAITSAKTETRRRLAKEAAGIEVIERSTLATQFLPKI